MPDIGNWIPPRNIAQAMWDVSWRDVDKIYRGLFTFGLESNYYERNVGTNPDGSRDRGVCQINDRAHPDCSDAVAFNYRLAIEWTFHNLYKPAHYDYTDWAAYNNLVKPFLAGQMTDTHPKFVVVRSKAITAADAVGNFLKQKYGVLA